MDILPGEWERRGLKVTSADAADMLWDGGGGLPGGWDAMMETAAGYVNRMRMTLFEITKMILQTERAFYQAWVVSICNCLLPLNKLMKRILLFMFSQLNDSTQSIDALETVTGYYNGMRATVFETTQDMMNGTLNYVYEMEINLEEP